MGIVARQSIKNAIFSYAGIVIGAIYTIFMVPGIFDARPEEWGLIQLIMSYVMILLPFALLGLPNIILRYWHQITSEEKRQFIGFIYFVGFIGLIILSTVLILIKDYLVGKNENANPLLNDYFPYTILILAFQIFFFITLNYCRTLLKTSVPTGLKDSFVKFATFLLLIIYGTGCLSFRLFFYLYLVIYFFQLLFILAYARKITELKPAFSWQFFKNQRLREIFIYGGFSLLAGGTVMLVQRIDIIMISKMLTLKEVAYYSIAFFIMTAIMVPARSVSAIASPLLSKHIQEHNLPEIKKVYLSSSLNMFLFSGFIFLGTWVCVDDLMLILGDKFGQIKWVILFLGLGKIMEALNGMNQSILIYSRYYRWDFVLQVFLLAITIVTNLLLIPRYGMNGAALASLIAIASNQLFKAILVFVKYRIHPYNSRSLFLVLLFAVVLFLSVFIPPIGSPIISIFVKASFFTASYFIIIYIFNLSTELNDTINKILKR